MGSCCPWVEHLDGLEQEEEEDDVCVPRSDGAGCLQEVTSQAVSLGLE